VEFAVIMIVLLIIVFGTIEFGIAYSKVNVYTGAAREGGRYVATKCFPDQPCEQGDLEARVATAAVGYDIGPGTPTSTIGGSPAFCDDTTLGEEVTVSWDQNISVNIPFVPGLNPGTFTRHVEAVFRCE
jgi:Flp pilus assembly protein TadG